MAKSGNVNIDKYGQGYKILIQMLKQPLWFKNTHLSIFKFLKTVSPDDKQSIILTLITADLIQQGIRASEVQHKAVEQAQLMSSLNDDQLATYIFSIGYNKILLLLRSYARFKVLSTGMKKTG